MVSQRSLKLSSFPFILLPPSCFGQWFPPFWLPGHFWSSIILLLTPSSLFFISVRMVFCSSRSFINISCIFSFLFSQILDHLHYHYSEFFIWRLPISTLLSCFSGILSFSFIPGGSEGKASAYNAGDLGSIPGLGRSPGERNGNPLEYSCPKKSHVWRSLVGYSPWGHKESDTIEQLYFHFHLGGNCLPLHFD